MSELQRPLPSPEVIKIAFTLFLETWDFEEVDEEIVERMWKKFIDERCRIGISRIVAIALMYVVPAFGVTSKNLSAKQNSLKRLPIDKMKEHFYV